MKYRVTSPNGITITLDGDTPPSESDIVEAFEMVESTPPNGPPSNSFLNKTKDVAGMVQDGVNDFVLGRTFDDRVKSIQDRRAYQDEQGMNTGERILDNAKEGVKDVARDTARFASFAMPVSKAAKGLGFMAKTITQAGKQAGLASSTKFVEELAKGDSLDTSVKEAMENGVGVGSIALALPILGRTGKASMDALKPFFKGAKKTFGTVMEILNTVPRDYFEHALDESLRGNNILAKKTNPMLFHSLGKKAQMAINKINSDAGKGFNKEMEVLRNSSGFIKTKNIIDNAKKLIGQRSFDGETSIEAKDQRLIEYFLKKFTREDAMHPAKANIVKQEIQNKVNFKNETIKTPSPAGVTVLKVMAKDIKDLISEKNPEYKIVSDKYSRISEIRDKLKSTLSAFNAERSLKGVLSDGASKEKIALLEEVDELAPKNLKFMGEAKNEIVRKAYKEIFPGRGGGSGSSQGVGNFVKGGFFTNELLSGDALTAGAIAALVSPKFTGSVISGIGRGVKTSKALRPFADQYLARGINSIYNDQIINGINASAKELNNRLRGD